MRTYQDVAYCPRCDADTLQTIHDSQHERDSSNDMQDCLQCGAFYHGLTGKWTLNGREVIYAVLRDQPDQCGPQGG